MINHNSMLMSANSIDKRGLKLAFFKSKGNRRNFKDLKKMHLLSSTNENSKIIALDKRFNDK